MSVFLSRGLGEPSLGRRPLVGAGVVTPTDEPGVYARFRHPTKGGLWSPEMYIAYIFILFSSSH